MPPNWMLITVFLHIAAFMLVALLSGRLAQALIGSSAEAAGAKADTEEQLRRMQATNEQLRVMSESSRAFLRHQDVSGLVPEALRADLGGDGLARRLRAHPQPQLRRLRGARRRSAASPRTRSVATRSSASWTSRSAGAQRYESVTDPQVGRAAQGHGEGRVPRVPRGARSRPSTRCWAWSACCTAPARRCPRPPCHTLRALCDQVALVVRNIQFNEELARKNEELTHLDQLKSDFMATMSHELRTPLTSIIGYSDMLLSGMTGELNEKQSAFVDSILKGGESLLNLINDVLDLTKIEAGRLELNREAVDLRAALLGVLPVVKPRAAGQAHPHQHVPPHRPARSSGPTRASSTRSCST